jgi:hypothetical protein
MAQISVQISANTSSPILLWATTTGVSPDHAVDSANQYFRACTVNDPLPIIIENLDGTNPIYLGGASVGSANGTKIAAGGSITRNVVGNDSEYAISTGGTVSVAVEVGRQ